MALAFMLGIAGCFGVMWGHKWRRVRAKRRAARGIRLDLSLPTLPVFVLDLSPKRKP